MMHLPIVGAMVVLLASNTNAQATQAQAPLVASREITNVFPVTAAVEQFVMPSDSARTYYRQVTGGVWMYDRNAKTTTRVLDAVVWDLTLSPTKNALAYTKLGDNARDQYVWVLPLSATTGLASGKERRVSIHAGDVPSISPDGKLLAFASDDETGVGQTVVSVPIAGGTERVVAASQPSGINHIRWAPDGKTLYFGVNAPVPFTCAESCLTGARESRPSSTIRRVSATGGSITTVAMVGTPGPGLSPDGKFMVFADSGAQRRMVVADRDGNRLKTFSVPSSQTLTGWAGSSTLLTLATGQVRRLRAVSLPDGASRVLSQSNEFIFLPSWTPDSKSVSVNRYGANGCELSVMNADGSPQRTVSISKTGGCSNVAWTSDQRSIVFVHQPGANAKPVLTAIDVSTGQSKALRTLNDNSVQWVLDRDVVVFSETIRDANGSRRAIWQIDTIGNAKLLREMAVESGTSLTLVDRNRAIIARTSPRDFRVIAFATGELKPLAAVPRGVASLRPTLSVNRDWMGYLTGTDNAQLRTVQLVKLDGRERRTIDLSFSADGDGNLLVMSAGSGAIVGERRAPGQPGNVYFASASVRAANKLFTFVGQQAELALSPDGRTVLYLINELLPPTVSAIDISTLK